MAHCYLYLGTYVHISLVSYKKSISQKLCRLREGKSELISAPAILVSETVKHEWAAELGPGGGIEEGFQQEAGSLLQRTTGVGQASGHPGVQVCRFLLVICVLVLSTAIWLSQSSLQSTFQVGVMVPGQEEGEGDGRSRYRRPGV